MSGQNSKMSKPHKASSGSPSNGKCKVWCSYKTSTEINAKEVRVMDSPGVIFKKK